MIQNRGRLAISPAHALVLDCLEAGIQASQPKNAVRNALSRTADTLEIENETIDLSQYTEILILGGGKAGAQMARALEEVLGDHLSAGIVVTNDPVQTATTDVIEGAHPVPDEAGRNGAKRILSLSEQAGPNTLILCPLSGGGSALLPAPAGEISLSDLQVLTEELLASGATINEINSVRKHLSSIKGGRLAAAAAPATTIGLLLSDVVGNDRSVIASGPLVEDSSKFSDARSVLNQYDIAPPTAIDRHLEQGVAGEVSETPGPEHPAFDHVQTHVLADVTTAIQHVKSVVADSEYSPLLLSTEVEGEAREAAKVHAAIANEVQTTGNPVEPPVVLISGGETTVTIRGDGKGGPNQEFVLSGLLRLHSDDVVIGSVDTDGHDGATDTAGVVGTREVVDSEEQALNALAKNDAYEYFRDRSALIQTGPTGTNVNDLRVIAVPEN